MKKKSKQISGSTRLFWLLAGFIFCVMLVFNILTPYIADDYTFSFSYATGERLTGLVDTFQSQIYHYQTWSGRFLIKFLAQWFTIPPKMLFNVLNAAVYTGLGLLFCRMAGGRDHWKSPMMLLFVHLCLWQFSPVFGQTNLWMCGSFNYLWATFFCTLALLPFLLFSNGEALNRPILPVLTLIAGLVGGWSSENTSAGLLVALVLCIALALWEHHKAPIWMWTGLAGALCGFALLVLAPGNFQRHDAGEDPRGLFTILAVRFLSALEQLWKHGLILLLLFAVLYCLLVLQKPGFHALCLPLIPLLAGLAANFAMILSPVYYERSTHGVLAFLILACAVCAAQLRLPSLRPFAVCSLAILSVITCFQLIWAGYDIASFAMMRKVRDGEILAQKAEGITQVETYAIEPYTRWCGGYGLPDLRQDLDDWLCADTARYFGVDSVTAQEARTYPFPGRTNAAFEDGSIAEH